MKINIDGFLIVEGMTDKAFLSSFLNCEIVYTGGFAFPRGTQDYVLELSRIYQPIILTDPDLAGSQIRNNLLNIIPNARCALINKNANNSNRKNGVAESTKEEILKALKPYIIKEKLVLGNIKISDLYTLGINNKNVRNYVCEYFKIGNCNVKTMLNRLNFLKINIDQIKIVIKGYGNK